MRFRSFAGLCLGAALAAGMPAHARSKVEMMALTGRVEDVPGGVQNIRPIASPKEHH
jgi:hypothetical protein